MLDPKILSTETNLCPLCDDQGEIAITLGKDGPVDVIIDCPVCPKHPLQWTSHTEAIGSLSITDSVYSFTPPADMQVACTVANCFYCDNKQLTHPAAKADEPAARVRYGRIT